MSTRKDCSKSSHSTHNQLTALPQGTSSKTTNHTPVLLKEVLEVLNIQPGGRYVDCTAGGGGHAFAVLERSAPGGQLLAIDADPQAIQAARERLKPFGNNAILVNENFKYLEGICSRYDFCLVNGILFDLGVSSLQLADASRGFSFQHEAPLDMRFSPEQKLTAADMVNNLSEHELADLLRRYGEERLSHRIARAIIQSRPLKTTLELARVIEKAAPRGGARIHPATRTFQALRIAVNGELENLEIALQQAVKLLSPGGRLVVISFHSLEDRLVKNFLGLQSKGCLCPREAPVCVCGHTPTLRLVSKKVITPSPAELRSNPRSRSARMRAAERI